MFANPAGRHPRAVRFPIQRNGSVPLLEELVAERVGRLLSVRGSLEFQEHVPASFRGGETGREVFALAEIQAQSHYPILHLDPAAGFEFRLGVPVLLWVEHAYAVARKGRCVPERELTGLAAIGQLQPAVGESECRRGLRVEFPGRPLTLPTRHRPGTGQLGPHGRERRPKIQSPVWKINDGRPRVERPHHAEDARRHRGLAGQVAGHDGHSGPVVAGVVGADLEAAKERRPADDAPAQPNRRGFRAQLELQPFLQFQVEKRAPNDPLSRSNFTFSAPTAPSTEKINWLGSKASGTRVYPARTRAARRISAGFVGGLSSAPTGTARKTVKRTTNHRRIGYNMVNLLTYGKHTDRRHQKRPTC